MQLPFLVDAWPVPDILLLNEQNMRQGCIGFPRIRLVGSSHSASEWAEDTDGHASDALANLLDLLDHAVALMRVSIFNFRWMPLVICSLYLIMQWV